jgi:hypothetical protein
LHRRPSPARRPVDPRRFRNGHDARGAGPRSKHPHRASTSKRPRPPRRLRHGHDAGGSGHRRSAPGRGPHPGAAERARTAGFDANAYFDAKHPPSQAPPAPARPAPVPVAPPPAARGSSRGRGPAAPNRGPVFAARSACAAAPRAQPIRGPCPPSAVSLPPATISPRRPDPPPIPTPKPRTAPCTTDSHGARTRAPESSEASRRCAGAAAHPCPRRDHAATAPKALTATPARTSPRDLVRGPILPAPSRHTLFDSNSAAARGALAFGPLRRAARRPSRSTVRDVGRIARAAALLTPSAAPRLLLERPG